MVLIVFGVAVRVFQWNTSSRKFAAYRKNMFLSVLRVTSLNIEWPRPPGSIRLEILKIDKHFFLVVEWPAKYTRVGPEHFLLLCSPRLQSNQMINDVRCLTGIQFLFYLIQFSLPFVSFHFYLSSITMCLICVC